MGVGRLALTTPDEPLPSSRTTSSAESVKAPSLPPPLPVDAPPAGAPLDQASAPDGTPNIQYMLCQHTRHPVGARERSARGMRTRRVAADA